MLRERPNNEVLDAIAKAALAAGRLNDRELDEIILRPHIYAKVRTGIRQGRAETGRTARPFALRTAVVSLSCIVVVSAVAGALFFAWSGFAPNEIAFREVPAAAPEDARPESPPDRIDPMIDPGRVSVSPDRAAVSRSGRPAKPVRPRPRKTGQPPAGTSFYAVTYAGDPYETAGGGRVIRVEMPRSSLFALGAVLPLENEPATVTADLLIGPDGVTRAIRIVE